MKVAFLFLKKFKKSVDKRKIMVYYINTVIITKINILNRKYEILKGLNYYGKQICRHTDREKLT